MYIRKNMLNAAIGSAVLFSSSSFAQLEEIVVSGTLQSNIVNSMSPPLLIRDTPQAVAITTAEENRDRGFRELGDIVRYTAGVNQSPGEGHRDSVVFRGVRSTADFYRDGLRDDVQYYRSLYNVEQVEVLRGPNALLFGRGGTGGLINRVTDGDALAGAKELAARIVANGPLAVRVSKQVIKQSRGWPMDERYKRQTQLIAPVFVSEDAREGAAAFAEKRAPNWKGK